MPKAMSDDDMFEDDRDDIEISGEDEDAELEAEEEAIEEEEDEPVVVVKKKASKPEKKSSKQAEDEEAEVSVPKAAKAARKVKAVDEDAEEERPKSKGKEVKKMSKTTKEKAHRSTKRGPILAGYFSKPQTLHATYHGKALKATVTPDGMIKFNGDTFTSPSGAGSSIRKGKSKVDGWHFWKIENKKGELVLLDSLRSKKSA